MLLKVVMCSSPLNEVVTCEQSESQCAFLQKEVAAMSAKILSCSKKMSSVENCAFSAPHASEKKKERRVVQIEGIFVDEKGDERVEKRFCQDAVVRLF